MYIFCVAYSPFCDIGAKFERKISFSVPLVMGVGSRFVVGTGTSVGVGDSVGVGVAETLVGVGVNVGVGVAGTSVGVAGLSVGVGDAVEVGVAPFVGTGDGVVLVDAHAASIIAAISAIETITPFFMIIPLLSSKCFPGYALGTQRLRICRVQRPKK